MGQSRANMEAVMILRTSGQILGALGVCAALTVCTLYVTKSAAQRAVTLDETGHQTASHSVFASLVDCRNGVVGCQSGELLAPAIEEGVSADKQTLCERNSKSGNCESRDGCDATQHPTARDIERRPFVHRILDGFEPTSGSKKTLRM
jgi:hypothetical protein